MIARKRSYSRNSNSYKKWLWNTVTGLWWKVFECETILQEIMFCDTHYSFIQAYQNNKTGLQLNYQHNCYHYQYMMNIDRRSSFLFLCTCECTCESTSMCECGNECLFITKTIHIMSAYHKYAYQRLGTKWPEVSIWTAKNLCVRNRLVYYAIAALIFLAISI